MKEVKRLLPAPPVTRAAEAYSRIRSAILELEFVPGAPMSETLLAQALGISRTPVREALKLLEREGLVRAYPARGTFVAELSAADIVEIYEVRIQLESFAASVAATRLTDSDLAGLRDSVSAAETAVGHQRVDEACLLDIRLHSSIVSATGNRRIKQVLSQMDDQVHRIRLLASRDPERMRHTLDEHERIVSALMARDGALADKEMRIHLSAARENALRLGIGEPPNADLSFKNVVKSSDS
jgi:DNA-binding GntR family transcriptional regulator